MNTNKAIGILQAVKAGTADVFISKAAIKDALDMAISALEKQEKAFDEWCTDCKEYDHNRHCCPRFNKVIRGTLDEVGQQRWIPVTERLPEDEYVLISKKPTKLSGSKWSVTIAIRTEDPRSRKIQWRGIGFGVIQDDKVLAWRPLPEPFTEEDNDKS